MIKTKITIRPFLPACEEEDSSYYDKDSKRDPFAVLSYGNVKIELDYTILSSLQMDHGSNYRACRLCNSGIKEIIREMIYEMDGVLHDSHRDSEEIGDLGHMHDPLHSSNYPRIKIEKIDK